MSVVPFPVELPLKWTHSDTMFIVAYVLHVAQVGHVDNEIELATKKNRQMHSRCGF